MPKKLQTAQVISAVVYQDQVVPVKVQISKSSRSLPRVVMVGLAQKTVQESKDRVLAALRSSHVKWQPGKYTINLQPVNIPKKASSLDLAIALAFLQINQEIPAHNYVAVGELGLDGSVNPVNKQLSMSYHLANRYKQVWVSAQAQSLRQLPNLAAFLPVTNLEQVIAVANGQASINKFNALPAQNKKTKFVNKLQISKSCLSPLVTAIAGGHHTLFFGSPGVGKTFIQEVASLLLPELSPRKKLQQLIAADLNQQVGSKRLIAPSATITRTQLVGGYKPFQPGLLVNLQQGILFLDELPHYSLDTLRALAVPLETQQVVDSRGQQSWPCSFVCLATANPCSCGYFGLPQCKCSLNQVQQYVKNISGSLLDRFSLVWRVTDTDLVPFSYSLWKKWKHKVSTAWYRQQLRARNGFPECNQSYQLAQIRKLVSPQLISATSKDRPHLRQWLNTWRVAITLYDLENSKKVNKQHYLEAKTYTVRDQWPH